MKALFLSLASAELTIEYLSRSAFCYGLKVRVHALLTFWRVHQVNGCPFCCGALLLAQKVKPNHTKEDACGESVACGDQAWATSAEILPSDDGLSMIE